MYLGPYQTYGGTFSENSQRLKAINYFYKESSA